MTCTVQPIAQTADEACPSGEAFNGAEQKQDLYVGPEAI
jgi:hypothetical protein